MKLLGLILIIIGVVDVGGSWLEFDLWGDFFGIELPFLIWYFSGWVELGIGFFLFNLDDEIDE